MLTNLGLLIIRFVIGVLFMGHGLQKLANVSPTTHHGGAVLRAAVQYPAVRD